MSCLKLSNQPRCALNVYASLNSRIANLADIRLQKARSLPAVKSFCYYKSIHLSDFLFPDIPVNIKCYYVCMQNIQLAKKSKTDTNHFLMVRDVKKIDVFVTAGVIFCFGGNTASAAVF